MSLLGNRGRFTEDKKNISQNINVENESAISSLGKNPKSFLSVAEKKDEVKFDISERLKKVNIKDDYDEDYISDHKNYNDKLTKFNLESDKKSRENKNSDGSIKKKRVGIKTIAAMFIIEIFTLVAIFMIGSIYRITDMTQDVPFDPKKVINTEIPENTIKIMKGYKTVAVFGVDSRTGSVDKGNNADVNMIINLNRETGDVQLISVYRDLYLSITENNTYDKLNAAYRKGGPEQAVRALNKNLDLNIDSYFAFNWKAVADGIELLGGIDLEITKSEYKYMNAFIHETCIATGIDAKNPAAHYIKSSGMQHLDGVQAVAYGRLRLMDSDFQRVERQKRVIALCLEKAKHLDVPRIRLIIEAVLPQIAYAFDMDEILSLISIVRTINITESAGCPDVNNVITMPMGGSGDCVVPLNLEKAVIKLHKILFNVDDYTPSASVKRYSNRITELRAKYTEENLINESIKQSEEEASRNETAESSKAKANTSGKTRATASNAKKSEEDNKNLPISNQGEYAEEPENDDRSNLPISNSNGQNNTETSVNGAGSVPISNNVNETTIIQENQYRQYDAPGVPSGGNINPSNASVPGNPSAPAANTNAPVNMAPGTSANGNNGGVVVSGPPTGDVPSGLPNDGPVVPIITPH